MISYSVGLKNMPKGGSRYGAGRPGWKRKAEASTSIDIRMLARKGLLKVGLSFNWSWTNNYGDPAGSVNIKVQGLPERVVLNYRWTPYHYDARDIENAFIIDYTECNYGGVRPWFICQSCNRRCAVVYFGARGGRYACRKCVGISYYSQCEDAIDRAWRKQRKLEKHLDDNGNRPKGMHRKTYYNICAQINKCEEFKDLAIMIMANRMGFEF